MKLKLIFHFRWASENQYMQMFFSFIGTKVQIIMKIHQIKTYAIKIHGDNYIRRKINAHADNYIRKQMPLQKEFIQRVVCIRISYLFE